TSQLSLYEDSFFDLSINSSSDTISDCEDESDYEDKSNNKEKTLENIYDYVIKTYKGREEKYKLINYPKLFLYDVDKLIGKEQFLACHIQNHIIKTLLMNTNQFKDKDIQKKQVITNFLVVHQYLVMNINNQKYKIDPFFKIFKKL
ncbi:MAG: hypothetical protein WCP89_02110, partial [archaeon]